MHHWMLLHLCRSARRCQPPPTPHPPHRSASHEPQPFGVASHSSGHRRRCVDNDQMQVMPSPSLLPCLADLCIPAASRWKSGGLALSSVVASKHLGCYADRAPQLSGSLSQVLQASTRDLECGCTHCRPQQIGRATCPVDVGMAK